MGERHDRVGVVLVGGDEWLGLRDGQVEIGGESLNVLVLAVEVASDYYVLMSSGVKVVDDASEFFVKLDLVSWVGVMSNDGD